MIENGMSDVVAVLIAFHLDIAAVQHQLCAFLNALLDPVQNELLVSLGAHRSEVRGGIIGGTDLLLLAQTYDFSDQFIRNAFLGHHNGQSHAAFTGAAEGGVHDTGRGAGDRGVRQDQRMVLGFAQALYTLAVCSGGGIDMLADGSGPDKGNAAHIRMRQEDFGFIAGARNHIEDTVRDTGFLVQFCKPQTGHGRGGGGLEHERIAADNGQRRHPAHRDHGREVPGRNAGENTDGLTIERGVIAGGGVHQAFAHQQAGCRACQFGHFQCLAHIAGGLAQCLAVLGRAQECQLFHVLFNEVAQLHHHGSTLAHRGVPPCRIGSLGGFNGLFHFILGAAGDLGNDLACGRVIDGIELFRGTVDELAADKGFHDSDVFHVRVPPQILLCPIKARSRPCHALLSFPE